jgi:hypothetical protein
MQELVFQALNKIQKEEFYTYLTGLALSLLYFLSFFDWINSELNLDKGNLNYYLGIALSFLLLTALIYLISQVVVLVLGLVVKFILNRQKENVKKNYLENGVPARSINEMQVYSINTHIFSLLISLSFLSIPVVFCKLFPQFQYSHIALYIVVLLLTPIVILGYIMYLWFKLEWLYQQKAFILTENLNDFLTFNNKKQ